MKYVQKERGVVENEMGGESQEERGGRNVSGCVCVCVIYRDGLEKIERL